MPEDAPRILVVDDEPEICRNCLRILAKPGYHVEYVLNGYQALKAFEERPFDVVVTDLKMSSLGGMEVLRRVRERHPDTQVIVITGYSTVSSAVEVMKMGAFDYLPKPFTPQELRAVVHQALDEQARSRQNRRLKADTRSSSPVTHQLVGRSRKIQRVIGMIDKVSDTDATVLICGESGTGKELVARAVHANSKRSRKVFFAVDCGTLSGELLESELFGHVRGAFTGAHRDKQGIFALADGGTVFLDEISNTGMEVQGKLLRFLETREFMPLGADRQRRVDVRLIFATNRSLEDMVAEGAFRQDFYYRIFVYPILLPPLRDRREDILPIGYHFLTQFAQRMEKKIQGFSDAAVSRLTAHPWPGNVRQLRNAVERAVILCEGEQVGMRDLPELGEGAELESLIENVPRTNEELKALKKEIRSKAVRRVERNFVLNALTANDWNVTRAAEQVGLQRSNFQKLVKKYALRRRSPEVPNR